MRLREIVFKPYTQDQPNLLPPSLEELIPADHLVRVVNRMVDQIDLGPLLKKYKGGGTSSYHPGMMLKVMVYAYAEKVYSSRRIAKGLRENINFMWIAGGNRPDFRTINDFRGKVMKEAVREVFSSVMELLVEGGYVRLENYFVDGTKVGANANPHKVVWAKNAARHQGNLRKKIAALLDEIDQVNVAEEEEYGEEDLGEMGCKGGISAEKLKEKVEELNRRLREEPKNKVLKSGLKRLQQECLPKLEKYEEQIRKLNGRTSYSKTDEDASCFRMKEDLPAREALPKPAYNVQIGSENQYIVGYSIHQRAGDTSCFIPHMRQQRLPKGKRFQNIIADAGYGSEENYAYLEEQQLGNYLKYNTFHQELHPPLRGKRVEKTRFQVDHFPYDASRDEFLCPNGKRLHFQRTRGYITENGYHSQRSLYACEDCTGCLLKSECTRSQSNRQIQVSWQLNRYRSQARSNLTSDTGALLRKRRGCEVETSFGDIKHNMGFRRFMLRGLKKVEIEWGLLSIAYNMRKLALS